MTTHIWVFLNQILKILSLVVTLSLRGYTLLQKNCMGHKFIHMLE